MAEHESEHFIPDKIDEQIASSLAGQRTVQRLDPLDIQVVQALQRHYAPVKDDSRPLERVWNRLTQHRSSLRPSQREGVSQNELPLDHVVQPPAAKSDHLKLAFFRNTPLRHPALGRLSMIAALVFAILLVGSVFAVYHLAPQRPVSGQPTPPPNKHPAPINTDQIYIHVNHTIYRLDAVSYKPLWSFPMLVPNGVENIGSQAQVIGSVLYTLGTGSDGYYAYAINTSNGSLRWRFKVHYQSQDLSLVAGDQLIANGRVYLSEASAVNGYTLVTALDAVTGTMLWKHRYNGTGISYFGHYIDPTVGILLEGATGETLYGTIFTGQGDQAITTIFAISAKNGSVLWEKQVSTAHEMPDLSGGLVVDGVLCISTSQVGSPHLYGFDALTGEPKWSVPLDGGTYNVAASNGVVYIGTAHLSGVGMDVPATSGSLYAVRAKDGAQLWRYKAQAGVSSPTVQNGTIVVSVSRQDYKTPQQSIVALDASKGTVRWSLSAPAPGSFDLAFNPQVIASKNFVYAGISSKQVQVLRLSDGKLVDTFTVPGQGSLSEGVAMMTVVSF
ncbi:MAG TPA: PQQ-binding-like beta-propeller repeat protein [Ktedonobacteraceae bacterium]